MEIITFASTSNVLRVKILDSTSATGAGKTGLTFSSSGLIISTIADNEATATTYTQAGSTVETITTLGTFAAPTATKCRFKEVDATNHPGVYELQIADARFAVASAKRLLISISGVTGMVQLDKVIELKRFDLQSAALAAIDHLKLIYGVPNARTLWIVDPANGSAGGSGTLTAPYDTLVTWKANATPVSGDAVLMLRGVQYFGNNVVTMPAYVDVIGVSRTECILDSTATIASGVNACIFSPGAYSDNHGFTIRGSATQPASPGVPTYQAQLGYYGNAQGAFGARVWDVDLYGGTDNIYIDAGRVTTRMPLTLTITGSPGGGTFTISVGANTTAGIAYNASAATIQTAVTGLASVGAGNATVTGTGPFPITFKPGVAEAVVKSSGAGLTGGSSPDAVTTGTCDLSVKDVRFFTGWDFVAIENFFSENNTNGATAINDILYLENFAAYCKGVSDGGTPYLPATSRFSFGVNVVNEQGDTAATVKAYLKHGYISTYTTTPNINSRALAVQGPVAWLDVDDVDIVQFNSGSGGVINDAYAISPGNLGQTYLTLSNCRLNYGTISIDSTSTLITPQIVKSLPNAIAGQSNGLPRLGANIGNTTFVGTSSGLAGFSIDGLQLTNTNWQAHPLDITDSFGSGGVGVFTSGSGSAFVLNSVAGGHIFLVTPGTNKDVFHATLSGTGLMFNPAVSAVTRNVTVTPRTITVID
jgi:hypothetical protein